MDWTVFIGISLRPGLWKLSLTPIGRLGRSLCPTAGTSVWTKTHLKRPATNWRVKNNGWVADHGFQLDSSLSGVQLEPSQATGPPGRISRWFAGSWN